MPVFWHTSPPESRASACFGSSFFIFINGKSLPVLFYFIRSASAWDILLKSSSSWKSLIVMLCDTPLNIKIFSFGGVCRVIWFWQWHLNFWPENLFHFGFTLQDSKVLGSISYKNPTFWRLPDLENSEARMVLPQFAHYLYWCFEFWVNTCGNQWNPILVWCRWCGGLASRWERRWSRGLSLFAGWSLKATLCDVHGCHN